VVQQLAITQMWLLPWPLDVPFTIVPLWILILVVSAFIVYTGRKQLIPWVTSNQRGTMVVFFPCYVYDLVCAALFPLNYLISLSVYLQPDRSEWDSVAWESDDSPGAQERLKTLKERILSGEDVTFVEDELVRLFDSLPKATTTTHLVGRTFHGRIVRTGRSVLDLAEMVLVKPLTKLGLGWGKRYRSTVSVLLPGCDVSLNYLYHCSTLEIRSW
jgi:hypothetical protein